MIFSNKNKQTKFILRRLHIALPIVIILIFGVVSGVRYWYGTNLAAVNPSDQTVMDFKIEFGESVDSIAARLQTEGLIKNRSVFVWYVRRGDTEGNLQAGTYELTKAMNVETIVDLLASGKVRSNLVTIIPGKRLDEIAKALVSAGWQSEDIDSALKRSNYNHPLINHLPTNATLEGYVYPDSYEINDTTSAEDLITKSLDNFYEKLAGRDIEGRLLAQGLTLHEGVTLASIVAKESSDATIQKQVAQVFLSRLEAGMLLGSDVTFLYAAAIAGVEPTIDIDSPYNTRIYAGLPPGPIANFNISALDAVANPAAGDYLYFVAGDDGKVYFSRTLAEHNANAAKYCKKLCEL